jgi:hypothetical protein
MYLLLKQETDSVIMNNDEIIKDNYLKISDLSYKSTEYLNKYKCLKSDSEKIVML